MARVLTVYNNVCLKCNKVHSKMIKVGPMTFCDDCFMNEFGGSVSYDVYENMIIEPTHDNYKIWIEIYKKSWVKND